MIRRVALLISGLVPLLLATHMDAQGPPPDDVEALLRGLPASTFDKQPIGVRGMQLEVSSKLDPQLRQLVDQSRAGADIRSRSLDLGATAGDLRLPVLLNAPRPSVMPALVQEVRDLGGEVTATHDASVWVLLPAAAVDRLATSANVHYLSVQEQMQVAQQGPGLSPAVLSQRATRVEALHAAGIRGRAVKVGIIDLGFGSYSRLQKMGKVPAPKAVRSFPASRPFENPVVHGAACAEIVFAMAPEVELYLATVDANQGSSIAAAQWMLQQGVDIVSYSMGNSWSPGDGSGSMGRLVDQSIADNGLLWVVSSGNSGERHWSGANKDANGDKKIDIAPGLSHLLVAPFEDEIDMTIRWNDWGPDPRQPTSSQDIDAYLLAVPPAGSSEQPSIVAEAVDDQDGGVGQPVEKIVFKRAGIKGRRFALILVNARVSRPLDVHVFLDSEGAMAPVNALGSILSPASARHAIAVGAWDVQTSKLASYSSQGPTDDNRLKPEISAPTGLPSLAYDHVFHGTSASCPHAAGFAALIKQLNPSLKGLALRAAVMQAVEAKGTPVPNMMFGYGWIDGGRLRPAPAVAGGAPLLPPPAFAPTPTPAPSRPQSPQTVLLPLSWGGEVRTDVLDRMRQVTGTPEFLTRVIAGRDLYRLGDGLRVGFKTSESCQHLLLHRSSTGQYTVLAPREGMATSLVAGSSYVLPSDNETFSVTPPVGAEELILVCARQAMNLAAAGDRPPAGLVVSRHVYQVTQ